MFLIAAELADQHLVFVPADFPVTVGQEVKTGETVAIIEAMKMQNILKAERDGVVKAVGAKAGDPVAADDVLVEFA